MPVLILKEKDAAPRVIPLTKPLTTIGRRPMNDIVVTDPSVSRTHAEIAALPDGGYEIHDLGGRHPVRVNGQIVSRRRLRDKDRIEIGGSGFSSSEEEPAAAAGIELSMERRHGRKSRSRSSPSDIRQTLPFRAAGLGSRTPGCSC